MKYFSLCAAIVFLFQITVSAQFRFEKSTPEAEGISSLAIIKFLDALEKTGAEMHGFVFIKNGKLISENYWHPYNANAEHTMYSASKSFTSTAIGLASDEGKLNITEKLVDIYPELTPANAGENLRKMTIQDLLTMETGHAKEPTIQMVTQPANWEKPFFTTPVDSVPGQFFVYNSGATYMLSSILHKKTGENISQFLKPRLFDPLGITDFDWETNPDGIETGGWGLRLHLIDMAKFGQLYLQKGNWQGKQLISEKWVNEATSSFTDRGPEWASSSANVQTSDWLQGYGYQFWRCRNNAFRADGAYGQFILVMPDQNAVIAITEETQDMQITLNQVWEHLMPAMQTSAIPQNDSAFDALLAKSKGLGLDKNSRPPSRQEMALKFSANKDNIESLTINDLGNRIKLTLVTGGKTQVHQFGKRNWVFETTAVKPPNLLNGAKHVQEGIGAFITAGKAIADSAGKSIYRLRFIQSAHKRDFVITKEGGKTKLRIIPSNDASKTLEAIEE